MQTLFRGRVWKFGDCLDSGNINGVMAGVDPEFHKKVRHGDIIVAGINFGMGSTSEQAPRSLRDAGIAAVVAESISSIYLRTLVNLGLPAIECPDISRIVNEGNELEINLQLGEIRNISNGETRKCSSFSPHAIEILDRGGLIPFLKNTLGKKRKGRMGKGRRKKAKR
ncbi:MAG: 3-isopropylmalate dehydratase [Deltaproteobacteria bacterium]|nr:3-isopropylmalate dehydratase [Deltaproteobacteria bacterium]